LKLKKGWLQEVREMVGRDIRRLPPWARKTQIPPDEPRREEEWRESGCEPAPKEGGIMHHPV